jgi:putative ABC transport system substrate-binding protein
MLAGGVLAAPLAAEAQPTGKRYRIGFLGLASPADPKIQRWLAAFRDALAELGYVEGRNIAIESRWAGGKYERLPDLAAELVRLKTDVHGGCC